MDTNHSPILMALVKEPLIHLLLAGALLYGLYATLNPQAQDVTQQILTIEDANRILSTKTNSSKELSQKERLSLMTQIVDNEVLYHEAKRLGLDHDAMIKDRLVQKARFYIKGQFIAKKPTEEELLAFYEQNKSEFKQSQSATFHQLLVSEADMQEVRDIVEKSDSDIQLLGRLSPFVKRSFLSASFEHANSFSLNALFGEEFTTTLFQQPLSTWVGPIKSTQGLHVVKVSEISQEGIASYKDVRRRVFADLVAQQKKQWVNSQLGLLRESYQISPEAMLLDE